MKLSIQIIQHYSLYWLLLNRSIYIYILLDSLVTNYNLLPKITQLQNDSRLACVF